RRRPCWVGLSIGPSSCAPARAWPPWSVVPTRTLTRQLSCRRLQVVGTPLPLVPLLLVGVDAGHLRLDNARQVHHAGCIEAVLLVGVGAVEPGVGVCCLEGFGFPVSHALPCLSVH